MKVKLHRDFADKTKIWKFNVGDVKERALWNDNMKAYQDMLSATSTARAIVYYPCESQVVPQLGHLKNTGGVFERSKDGVPQIAAQ